jgi:NADH-quinone oxidoreductase subunit J
VKKLISGDLIVFFIMALISIFAAVMVMELPDIFQAALFLALLFAAIGGIYILLTAEFIAAIQILVYGGAVLILILFAIVLTKRSSLIEEIPKRTLVINLIATAGLILLLIQPLLKIPWPVELIEYSQPNTYSVGFSLFTDYVIPFEVVSLALLAALIGAIYLSKREVTR